MHCRGLIEIRWDDRGRRPACMCLAAHTCTVHVVHNTLLTWTCIARGCKASAPWPLAFSADFNVCYSTCTRTCSKALPSKLALMHCHLPAGWSFQSYYRNMRVLVLVVMLYGSDCVTTSHYSALCRCMYFKRSTSLSPISVLSKQMCDSRRFNCSPTVGYLLFAVRGKLVTCCQWRCRMYPCCICPRCAVYFILVWSMAGGCWQMEVDLYLDAILITFDSL